MKAIKCDISFEIFEKVSYFSDVDIPNLGKECWSAACGKGGNCDSFCGPKAACCKKGFNDPPECVTGCKDMHCCTRKKVEQSEIKSIGTYPSIDSTIVIWCFAWDFQGPCAKDCMR